jgi:hypothetical protein
MRVAGVAARVRRMAPPWLLPVRIGDKPLKGLDSRKEARFGFRSAGFGFRSRRTLILFRLVLILFRRILNSFHATWRLERSAAWPASGLRRCDFPSNRTGIFPLVAWRNLPRREYNTGIMFLRTRLPPKRLHNLDGRRPSAAARSAPASNTRLPTTSVRRSNTFTCRSRPPPASARRVWSERAPVDVSLLRAGLNHKF